MGDTVKSKVEILDKKVDNVCLEIKDIKENHIFHLSVDMASMKGQLIYIKWFILAIMGLVITSVVKLWLL